MYWFSRNFLWLILKLLFRMRVSGVEHVPKTGGFILAPNHQSYWDPPAIGSASPRKVYFMAKEELFRIPLLAPWMRAVGTFPVKRGRPDRRALRHAADLVKQGECLCVFPEGQRVAPGEEKEGELGLAMIAEMAQAPVVPVAIVGAQPLIKKYFGFFPWFNRLEIRFGKVLQFDFGNDPRKHHEEFTRALKILMTRIHELKSGSFHDP